VTSKQAKSVHSILPDALHHPSPNQDKRPAGCIIDLLVIHNISLPPGEYAGPWIDRLFLNQLDPTHHPFFQEIYQLKVSSHLLIRRSGELIQYVPFDQRAWHAGASSFCGRESCNDYSIGIELEGTDHQPYSDPQYATLVKATADIMLRFPAITLERIVGHADIAPGRKTDPGPSFDWKRYRQLLLSRLATL
jgi:AmpD protein